MFPTLLEQSRAGVGGSGISDASGFEAENCESFFEDLDLRTELLGLPDVSEIEVVRHFMKLSSASHGVDSGSYPLGSCTMKYNPKRNDTLANLDGFKGVHPHQPTETLQGVLSVMHHLQELLAEITGMDHFSLQPAAGAQGELTGLLIIKKYFSEKKENRSVILIADSAHGTNPSSAAMAGFQCRIVPTDAEGFMDIKVLQTQMTEEVAGIMLTNPSTLGLFEEHIMDISKIVHDSGGLLYYDGANLNALMGITRPGDMGFDVVHVNTHKTFATPHGGGGPGAGPVGVKSFLEKFLPVPVVTSSGKGTFNLDYDRPVSIGRLKSHLGHFAVLVRAYCYILSMGPDGLRQASEDAVLNANYMLQNLRDLFPPPFKKTCMHECLVSGEKLPTTPYNFVKRLIDYGIHPPTLVGAGCVYFPNQLSHAMLIEPTETETKASLDHMIAVFRKVYNESLEDVDFVNKAPHTGSTRKVPQQSKVIDE